MTNKEYVINKIQDIINGLYSIKDIVLRDGIPNNEDWLKCAMPLNDMMNIIGNYRLCKDNEFGSDVFCLQRINAESLQCCNILGVGSHK